MSTGTQQAINWPIPITDLPEATAPAPDDFLLIDGPANGTRRLPASVATATAAGADPTALVGLTAKPGVATTFLRSDGAPGLDQAIAPTWTAQHKFNVGIAAGGSNLGYAAVIALKQTGTKVPLVIDPIGASAAVNPPTGGIECLQNGNLAIESYSLYFYQDSFTRRRILQGLDDSDARTSLPPAGNSSAVTLKIGRTNQLVSPTVPHGIETSVDGNLLHYTDTGGTRRTFSFAAAANPTASVGTAIVNGSATTFMRSDGAPAISQAIAPTWSAAHRFNGSVSVRAAANANAMLAFADATNVLCAFKFGSASVLLTTPLAGALEFDGTDLYITSATPTRKKLTATLLAFSIPSEAELPANVRATVLGMSTVELIRLLVGKGLLDYGDILKL